MPGLRVPAAPKRIGAAYASYVLMRGSRCARAQWRALPARWSATGSNVNAIRHSDSPHSTLRTSTPSWAGSPELQHHCIQTATSAARSKRHSPTGRIPHAPTPILIPECPGAPGFRQRVGVSRAAQVKGRRSTSAGDAWAWVRARAGSGPAQSWPLEQQQRQRSSSESNSRSGTSAAQCGASQRGQQGSTPS